MNSMTPIMVQIKGNICLLMSIATKMCLSINPKGICSSERFNVVCDCIVGFSWWGESATKNTCTQTEPSTIDTTTNTGDEFPVFGYPSARSKMDYLKRKVFGFNNHITPELKSSAEVGQPTLGLERDACDQWQANQELPRELQTFDWIDAARQKAIVVLSWIVSTQEDMMLLRGIENTWKKKLNRREKLKNYIS